MKRMIYMDYNATAPLRPEAQAAMAGAFASVGNPSSVHGAGRAAKRLIEDARDKVAALAGVRASQVIFTSGGTEANNLALRGLAGRRVLVSAIEHPCVLEARQDAEVIAVDRDGRVRLDVLHDHLAADDRPALVSVMLANNETGVTQPVPAVAEIAHAFGALVHTDAAQAAGKLPIPLDGLGVDLLTLSAHKFGGPQGAGALVFKGGLQFDAVLRGGGQEQGRRAGTENVAGIAGFGAAAAAAMNADMTEIEALRDRLEAGVKEITPRVQIFGRDLRRLPNTSCFAAPGMEAETLVMALDLAGVCVSAGSACSSGKMEQSHVLDAMGVAPALARGAIRLSLGAGSSEGDVEGFLTVWREVVSRLSGDELAA